MALTSLILGGVEMSSVVGYLAPVVFIIGIIFAFIRRVKYSDCALMAEKHEVFIPALASGFIVGILTAFFYVLVAAETDRFEEINWFLVMGGIAILGGGIVGLIVQAVSALPAKLWCKFFRK